jgi:undecaprenyl diphosphate synthase
MEDRLNHVAIIMDGNRTYARERGMPDTWGHQQGYHTLKNFLEYFPQYEIPVVSVYGFSTENFERSPLETKALFSLMEKGIHELVDRHNGYHITFPGDKTRFPDSLQECMDPVESRTLLNAEHQLNICLGYGAKDEIIRATRNVTADVLDGKLALNDITEETMQLYLDVPDPVDLLIRTSKQRISNFLLYQHMLK